MHSPLEFLFQKRPMRFPQIEAKPWGHPEQRKAEEEEEEEEEKKKKSENRTLQEGILKGLEIIK